MHRVGLGTRRSAARWRPRLRLDFLQPVGWVYPCVGSKQGCAALRVSVFLRLLCLWTHGGAPPPEGPGRGTPSQGRESSLVSALGWASAVCPAHAEAALGQEAPGWDPGYVCGPEAGFRSVGTWFPREGACPQAEGSTSGVPTVCSALHLCLSRPTAVCGRRRGGFLSPCCDQMCLFLLATQVGTGQCKHTGPKPCQPERQVQALTAEPDLDGDLQEALVSPSQDTRWAAVCHQLGTAYGGRSAAGGSPGWHEEPCVFPQTTCTAPAAPGPAQHISPWRLWRQPAFLGNTSEQVFQSCCMSSLAWVSGREPCARGSVTPKLTAAGGGTVLAQRWAGGLVFDGLTLGERR